MHKIDPRREAATGIGLERHLRALTDLHASEILFIHISNDPHLRQVGDAE